MAVYSDLQELKKVLDVDPTDDTKNAKILILAEQASSIIDEFIGREILQKSRTEFYNGTNTQTLLLNSRPVYTTPTIQCWQDDADGNFGQETKPTVSFTGSTQLTYGTDFVLAVDQSDGTSRSGRLIRINDFWNRPISRRGGLLSPFIDNAFGNIKVIYTAGYTVDNLPAVFRLACNLLVARLKMVFPLGFLSNSEAYEERSVSLTLPEREHFIDIIKPLLWGFRNWKW